MEPSNAGLAFLSVAALLNPTGNSCSGLCAGSMAGRCLITSLLFRVAWQWLAMSAGPPSPAGKGKGGNGNVQVEQPPEGNDF